MVITKMAGINVKTWCAPAINNRKKPLKLSWVAGTALPPSLALELPFNNLVDPTSDDSTSAAPADLRLTSSVALSVLVTSATLALALVQ